jgi:hypothetical protein
MPLHRPLDGGSCGRGYVSSTFGSSRAPLSAHRRIGRTARQGPCMPGSGELHCDEILTPRGHTCEIEAFDQLSESAVLIDAGRRRRRCRLCASAVEPSGARTCRSWFCNEKNKGSCSAPVIGRREEEDTSPGFGPAPASTARPRRATTTAATAGNPIEREEFQRSNSVNSARVTNAGSMNPSLSLSLSLCSSTSQHEREAPPPRHPRPAHEPSHDLRPPDRQPPRCQASSSSSSSSSSSRRSRRRRRRRSCFGGGATVAVGVRCCVVVHCGPTTRIDDDDDDETRRRRPLPTGVRLIARLDCRRRSRPRPPTHPPLPMGEVRSGDGGCSPRFFRCAVPLSLVRCLAGEEASGTGQYRKHPTSPRGSRATIHIVRPRWC